MAYWTDFVRCPLCPHECRRSNLLAHLRGKQHSEQIDDNRNATPQRLRPYLDQATVIAAGPSSPPKRGRPPRTESRTELRRDRAEHVRCDVGDCIAVVLRKNYAQHLRAGLHGFSKDQARHKARTMRPIETLPATVEVIPTDLDRHARARQSAKTVGFDPRAIDPTEIAVAVVQSQVNGSFPSDLLPEILTFVDVTREVVGRLRGDR